MLRVVMLLAVLLRGDASLPDVSDSEPNEATVGVHGDTTESAALLSVCSLGDVGGLILWSAISPLSSSRLPSSSRMLLSRPS